MTRILPLCVLMAATGALAGAPPPSSLSPLPLARRPHAAEPRMDAGGDVVDLPRRKPGAAWLPIDLSQGLRLRFPVRIQGHELTAIIDTGAYITTISASASHALGLDAASVSHRMVTSFDINHKKIEHYRVHLGTVELGDIHLEGLEADVVPRLADCDILLGFEVLFSTDLLFALDEGLLGVFPAGKGTLTARDSVVRISVRDRAFAALPLDDSGRITAVMLIDTGAPHSTLDPVVADPAAVPLDHRFARAIAGFDGTGKASKGAYVLPHFRLGRERVDVGPVLADQAYESILGNDVLMRHRTLLASHHAELRFAPMPIRPAFRTHGPDGAACAGKCVEAAVEQRGGVPCLRLRVGKAWGNKHVLALVDVLDDDGASAVSGGFFIYELAVPAAGTSTCGDPDGVLRTFGVKPGAPVSLLRFHVPSAAGRSCGQSGCLSFTGVTERAARAGR